MVSRLALYGFSLAVIAFTALVMGAVAGLILAATARLARRCVAPGLYLAAFVVAVVAVALAVTFAMWVWALVVLATGTVATFAEAMLFVADNFTTLGSMDALPAPWEMVGPVIAVNGLLVFAIAGGTLLIVLLAAYREEAALVKGKHWSDVSGPK